MARITPPPGTNRLPTIEVRGMERGPDGDVLSVAVKSEEQRETGTGPVSRAEFRGTMRIRLDAARDENRFVRAVKHVLGYWPATPRPNKWGEHVARGVTQCEASGRVTFTTKARPADDAWPDPV